MKFRKKPVQTKLEYKEAGCAICCLSGMRYEYPCHWVLTVAVGFTCLEINYSKKPTKRQIRKAVKWYKTRCKAADNAKWWRP